MMPEPRPQRVTVVPKPDGSELHIPGYARDLLVDVIALLAENPQLMDDFDRVITGPSMADPFHPERHLPTECLVEGILNALPTSATAIRLHQDATERLAHNLGRTLPAGPVHTAVAA